jgi:hypothetical protein
MERGLCRSNNGCVVHQVLDGVAASSGSVGPPAPSLVDKRMKEHIVGWAASLRAIDAAVSFASAHADLPNCRSGVSLLLIDAALVWFAWDDVPGQVLRIKPGERARVTWCRGKGCTSLQPRNYCDNCCSNYCKDRRAPHDDRCKIVGSIVGAVVSRLQAIATLAAAPGPLHRLEVGRVTLVDDNDRVKFIPANREYKTSLHAQPFAVIVGDTGVVMRRGQGLSRALMLDRALALAHHWSLIASARSTSLMPAVCGWCKSALARPHVSASSSGSGSGEQDGDGGVPHVCPLCNYCLHRRCSDDLLLSISSAGGFDDSATSTRSSFDAVFTACFREAAGGSSGASRAARAKMSGFWPWLTSVDQAVTADDVVAHLGAHVERHDLASLLCHCCTSLVVS